MQKKEYKVVINAELCKGCELCVSVCPQHCLAMGKDLNTAGSHYAIAVRAEHCSGCKRCAIICPDAVIMIEAKDEKKE